MAATEGRRQQYFVPGEGIAREVIQADVCKYLDNDATVRPGNFHGHDGYFLFAYRNFTNEMLTDLRNDSTRWRQEKQDIQRSRPAPRAAPSSRSSTSRGPSVTSPEVFAEPQYVNSDTYERSGQRTQARRDAFSDTPVPQGYPAGRGPPPGGYNDHIQSDYSSTYTSQPSSLHGRSTQAPYSNNDYHLAQDPQYPRGVGAPQGYSTGHPHPGYPPHIEQQYARDMEPPMANSRAYQPGYPLEPQPPRDPYYDSGHDPNYDPRRGPSYESSYDPRADPRNEPRSQRELRYASQPEPSGRRRGR